MSSELIQASSSLLSTAMPAITGLGGFFAAATTDIFKDAANLAGGNQMKVWSLHQYAVLAAKARKQLEDAGIDPGELSPSVGVPLLEAASMETRDELVDLWIKLLATAMDPKKASSVRYRFIDILKKMDPQDALMLNDMCSIEAFDAGPMAHRLGISLHSFQVTIGHLMELGLVHTPHAPFEYLLTAVGVEFRSALGLSTANAF